RAAGHEGDCAGATLTGLVEPVPQALQGCALREIAVALAVVPLPGLRVRSWREPVLHVRAGCVDRAACGAARGSIPSVRLEQAAGQRTPARDSARQREVDV